MLVRDISADRPTKAAGDFFYWLPGHMMRRHKEADFSQMVESIKSGQSREDAENTWNCATEGLSNTRQIFGVFAGDAVMKMAIFSWLHETAGVNVGSNLEKSYILGAIRAMPTEYARYNRSFMMSNPKIHGAGVNPAPVIPHHVITQPFHQTPFAEHYDQLHDMATGRRPIEHRFDLENPNFRMAAAAVACFETYVDSVTHPHQI